MTLAELKAARDAAGATYAAAAATLVDAWVELAAHDSVAQTASLGVVGTAGPQPQIVGHPEFLRGDTLTALNRSRSEARLARIQQLRLSVGV